MSSRGSALTSGDRRSGGLATASLVLGLMFFLGALTGIPAVILGVSSLRRIRRGEEPVEAKPRAVAGTALGALGIALTVGALGSMPWIMAAWRKADPRPIAQAELRMYAVAAGYYARENDGELPWTFEQLRSIVEWGEDDDPAVRYEWVLLPRRGPDGELIPWRMAEIRSPGETLLIREKVPRRRDGRRWAAFVDGHAELIPQGYRGVSPVPAGSTMIDGAMRTDTETEAKVTDMQVEVLADYENACGEGPLWHPDEKVVYWTDIPTGRLFRYDPSTGKHEQVYQGAQVGGMTLQADGSLLLFMEKGAVKVWRDGEFVRTIIEELPDEVKTRFNDVIADPRGRVFCGTMPVKNERPGRLYRLDTDGSIHLLLEDIGCSNGMGFSPDRKLFYYTDTPSHTIWLFDYDERTGAITNRRPFVEVRDSKGELGKPDGMTVDADGHVWSALWDGSCVVRYSPDGKEVQRIEMPAKNVTCPAFGGEDYSRLYITTAIGGSKREQAGNAEAGKLLRVTPGVKGVAEFRSRVGLD